MEEPRSKKVLSSSLNSLMRVLLLFIRAEPLWFNQLLKAIPLNTVALGIKLRHEYSEQQIIKTQKLVSEMLWVVQKFFCCCSFFLVFLAGIKWSKILREFGDIQVYMHRCFLHRLHCLLWLRNPSLSSYHKYNFLDCPWVLYIFVCFPQVLIP